MTALERIESKIDRIEARLLGQPRETDEAVMTPLLPGIGGRFGSDWWITTEMLAFPELKAMIGTRTNRQVGKLLSRNVGKPFRGYILERLEDTEHSCVLWRAVVQIETPHTPRPSTGNATELV